MAEQDVRHAMMPCPGCAQAVHVVVNDPPERSRWVCLACRAFGSGPVYDRPAAAPEEEVSAGGEPTS